MYHLTSSRRVTPRRETRRLDDDVGGSWWSLEAAGRQAHGRSIVGDGERITIGDMRRDHGATRGRNPGRGVGVMVAQPCGVVRRGCTVVPVVVGVFARMMAVVMVRQLTDHGRHRAVFMRDGQGVLDSIGCAHVRRTHPRHHEGDAERLYEQSDVGP